MRTQTSWNINRNSFIAQCQNFSKERHFFFAMAILIAVDEEKQKNKLPSPELWLLSFHFYFVGQQKKKKRASLSFFICTDNVLSSCTLLNVYWLEVKSLNYGHHLFDRDFASSHSCCANWFCIFFRIFTKRFISICFQEIISFEFSWCCIAHRMSSAWTITITKCWQWTTFHSQKVLLVAWINRLSVVFPCSCMCYI